MEFPRKNSEKSWMKYIYFCLYSLFVSSCFTFWMKSSVYIWIEISLLQSVHNVANWLDPPTITFFRKFIYIAGNFFKICNFAQIVNVFCLLVFWAQFSKVVCGLIMDVFGHRFKQFFWKTSIFYCSEFGCQFFSRVSIFVCFWEKWKFERTEKTFQ